jgi:hypothetical protein
VDEIIVIKDGMITENGTFKQLMKNKGHLYQLVGEHVQIIDEEEELPETLYLARTYSQGSDSSTSLNTTQLNNRLRMSFKKYMQPTDENMAIQIENVQLNLINGEHTGRDSVNVFERNRMSLVTENREEETVIPSDAEPMKLVLEDQSVYYKKLALKCYLKAGTGVLVTLTLFAFFFLVHGVRIGSGKLEIINS